MIGLIIRSYNLASFYNLSACVWFVWNWISLLYRRWL